MRTRKSTEARKEEIIRAALTIIEKHGLDNLNINDIADRIKLVPSAIYRHFNGKEEIVAALIEFADRALQHNINRAMALEASTIAKLKLLFELHVNLLKEESAIPRILYFLLSSDRSPELKASMLFAVNRFIQQVAMMLRQGQDKGEISPYIDSVASAMLFLGMVQPLAILSQFDKEALNDYPPKLWESYQRSITA